MFVGPFVGKVGKEGYIGAPGYIDPGYIGVLGYIAPPGYIGPPGYIAPPGTITLTLGSSRLKQEATPAPTTHIATSIPTTNPTVSPTFEFFVQLSTDHEYPESQEQVIKEKVSVNAFGMELQLITHPEFESYQK